MKSKQTPTPEAHVLVFQDNFEARSFRLPLAWMRRFGTLLAIGGFLTLASLGLAARSWWLAKNSQPVQLDRLEEEIQSLRAQLSAKTTPASTTQTTSPAPQPPGLGSIAAFTKPFPAVENLSFKIGEQKAGWRGRVLQVRFSLQYALTDGGKQEGRIIIIARGPQTLLAYPPATLNALGNGPLLDVTQGETFSVSRYRAAAADFGPLPASMEITEAYALLVSADHEPLVLERIPITPGAPAPTASPSPTL